MKQIHATTSYGKTYARMLVLFALSLAIVFLIPSLTDAAVQAYVQTNISNAGLLYAILIGFLLYITLLRKQGMEEAISLELNKARRLYHLALHLKKTEPRLESWFRELKKGLEAYHAHFRKIDFRAYATGDALFRKVTYTIYRLPALELPYNQELYASLLDAAASATEARETINDKMEEYLGRFAWIVMLVVTAVFCLVIALATPDTMIAKSVSAALVFSLLLALQLMFEYDRSNIIRNRYFSSLYVQNMTRAEREDGKKK
jgi:hypothetical protein